MYAIVFELSVTIYSSFLQNHMNNEYAIACLVYMQHCHSCLEVPAKM